MLNAIKSLLASGQNISLTGLDLFMTNDGTTRTGHQLGVYDNGKLKIVSVVDEFGNPLTAQSPDSAWLKGPDRVRRRCLRRGIAAQGAVRLPQSGHQ